MKDVDRSALALSACLAAVAGFVDAIGFLDTGGLFVSFMSGNSTQGAVGIGAGAGAGPGGLPVALVSIGIIAAFVAGVTVGGIMSAIVARPRPWIIAGAGVGVGVTAALALAGPSTLWRVALLAASMGALNTLFLADGRARVAITYSTGTLVSLGLAVSALFTGGPRNAWRRPLLLWSALAAGAVVGSLAHRAGSPAALTLAALVLAGAAVAMQLADHRTTRS